jgi:dUTPase
MVLSPVFRASFEEVDELPSTGRQEGGFGHTGR